jgi:hypothetical protein
MQLADDRAQVQALGGQDREPSVRSKRIWWPKTERVPVPVRSDLSTPWSLTWSRRSRYWPHAASVLAQVRALPWGHDELAPFGTGPHRDGDPDDPRRCDRRGGLRARRRHLARHRPRRHRRQRHHRRVGDPDHAESPSRWSASSSTRSAAEAATSSPGSAPTDTAHSGRDARVAGRGGRRRRCCSSRRTTTSRPSAGLLAHCRAVADATDLPVMPLRHPRPHRHPLRLRHLLALAEHPRIQAVKDAKGDLAAASGSWPRRDLAWYSGDDILNLPASRQSGPSGRDLGRRPRHRRPTQGERWSRPSIAGDRRARSTSTHPCSGRRLRIMNTSQGVIMAKAGARRPSGSSRRSRSAAARRGPPRRTATCCAPISRRGVTA